MSFKSFIAEGLIKLPPGIQKQMHEFFLTSYFSFAYASIYRAAKDEIDRKLINAVFKQLTNHYGVPAPNLDKGSKLMSQKTASLTLPKELPKEYLAALEKKAGKGSLMWHMANGDPIKVVLHLKPDKSTSRGKYSISGRHVELSIYNSDLMPSRIEDLVLISKVQPIIKLIDKAITTLDHEMTHAMQYIILGHIHSKNLDDGGVTTDHDKDLEKYHMSAIEFDPWIKNSITDVKHLEGFAKGTRSQKIELIKKYTWDDIPQAKLRDEKWTRGRSDFFKALKLNDPDKWKKASKLLVQNVLESLIEKKFVHDGSGYSRDPKISPHLQHREPDKHIAPHEGKELKMMLDGVKPVAIVNVPRIYHEVFEPYVDSGKLIMKRSQNNHCYVIGLPSEEWKIDKVIKLLDQEKSLTKEAWNAYTIKLGRLLGYPKENIKTFLGRNA